MNVNTGDIKSQEELAKLYKTATIFFAGVAIVFIGAVTGLGVAIGYFIWG